MHNYFHNCKTHYDAFMAEMTAENPETPVTLAKGGQPSWIDQDQVLRELWLGNEKPEKIAEKLGRSVAAIMTRAARLGLPRRAAPGRKPGYKRKEPFRRKKLFDDRLAGQGGRISNEFAEAPSMQMVRVCLMCLKRFQSEGRHNRICPSCKGSAEYSAGSSIPDMFKGA